MPKDFLPANFLKNKVYSDLITLTSSFPSGKGGGKILSL